MNTTYESARTLVKFHREEDPSTNEVYFFDAPDEIRLLEISTAIGYTGEVLPFRFAPRPKHGIDHPSVVILLNPQELEEIKSGRLSLPSSWGALDMSRKVA